MICSSSVCDPLYTRHDPPPKGRLEDLHTGDLRPVEMLRRQSSSVIRLTASHISRPHRYIRHQPLSVRSACRPTSRSSHHPTNLPQIYPRSSSPSRKNSTLSSSSSRTTGVPSRRMRFVRRFVETVPTHSPPEADVGLGRFIKCGFWNVLLHSISQRIVFVFVRDHL